MRSYPDRLLLVEPYQGYPADKAGLKAGDEIVQIGDIKVADFDDNASELLKGANNTSVSVVFKRQGKIQTATIEREGVEVDAVPFYGMADEQTGYIVLSRFNRKASRQTKAAIIDLKGQGAERLILDLRGNPGRTTFRSHQRDQLIRAQRRAHRDDQIESQKIQSRIQNKEQAGRPRNPIGGLGQRQ